MAVEDALLQHWRNLAASQTPVLLADYAKRDPDFKPLKDRRTTRWHASVGNQEFELLCTGPKFLDTRADKGGRGAVDLAMHLLSLNVKQAAKLLRGKGL